MQSKKTTAPLFTPEPPRERSPFWWLRWVPTVILTIIVLYLLYILGSVALIPVLASFAMAYLLLRRTATRTVLILAIVPIAIIKNAVRIVALSWLAVYVDPSFITGSFVHSSGGIPIFVLALTMLGAVVLALRRFDRRSLR